MSVWTGSTAPWSALSAVTRPNRTNRPTVYPRCVAHPPAARARPRPALRFAARRAGPIGQGCGIATRAGRAGRTLLSWIMVGGGGGVADGERKGDLVLGGGGGQGGRPL